MENYFQIRSIPYVRTVDAYPAFEQKMKKMVGIHQMPAVVLPDGRWMTDTTKMIQWLSLSSITRQFFQKILFKILFAY